MGVSVVFSNPAIDADTEAFARFGNPRPAATATALHADA
jgi:hypothetical protein